MKDTMEVIKKAGAVVATAAYSEPESYSEAIEVDGGKKVFDLYLAERKTRCFMDPIRLGVPKLVGLATARIAKEVAKGARMDTQVLVKLGKFIESPKITPEIVAKLLDGKYKAVDSDLDSCMELL